MKNLLKQIAFRATALSVACFSFAAYAETDPADMPVIMTLKTNIYGYQGPSNGFTIYLGATEENTEFYVEAPNASEYVTVGRYTIGTDSEGEHAVIATPVSLNVSETDNEVRIYGDSSKLDYIDVHGCYLNSFELNGELVNLSVIDLSHNELTAIDLSKQTALNSIDLLDNAFQNPDLMKIGTVHPALLILSVGINDVIDPELDLKNFPALQYFSARNNYGLYECDPSHCPDLVSLVLEVTNISSLDVSNNANLDVLNISNTRIKEIDLSNNVNLGEFYMSHEGSYNSSNDCKITSIDVSKNPKLQYLDLGGNLLTEIDLSNNNDLRLLYLQHNNIAELDLNDKPYLANVNLSYNDLTFATLPLPEEGWDYYYYRSPLPCDMKYKVGEKIDFASMVIRAPYEKDGALITPKTYASVFGVPKLGDPYEIEEDKYEYSDGVITFNTALPDSVFVDFYCDAFPEWSIASQNFMVKTAAEFDAPAASFSFTPIEALAGQNISFKLGGSAIAEGIQLPVDVTLYIDDNAITLENALTSSSLPQSDNVSFTMPSTGGKVTLTLPDGVAVTALEMDGIALESIDLTPAQYIDVLAIRNAGLSQIDLSFNRSLVSLDLSDNEFVSLDLAGVRGDYEKVRLTDLNVSGNKLRNLNSTQSAVIQNLNISNNNFSVFDLKYYTGLINADFSNNSIGELDFSKAEIIETIDVTSNQLYSLEGIISEELVSVDCSDNNLTFATLPTITAKGVEYKYAPQKKLPILTEAPAINLSAQNVINGSQTVYVWKYASDNSVVPESEYTINEGATVFGESLKGVSLYCEMTNPAFPQFDATPLTTTDVKASDVPTNLVASFTTTNDGTAEIGFRFADSTRENAVYIDWRGDGSQYEPYVYEANSSGGIYRTGNSFAGANVKVYSYESPENVTVFAMNHTPLSNFDGSPMTKLEALDIHNADLEDGSIILPQSEALWELVLDGNKFVNQVFEGLPGLRTLNLANNRYTEFDMAPYQHAFSVQIANNRISKINFSGNENLYDIDLTDNSLTEIDLTECPYLSQLVIASNNLTEIDLTPVSQTLRALSIAGNRFTFATLPLAEEVGPSFNTYYYANQKPMETVCENGMIDLSSQAYVGGNPTEFRWFLGDNQSDVYYDAYTEMFVGEELEGPEMSSDPEYTIEDGITTFLYPQTKKVIAAMTNSMLPNLILYTTPTEIQMSGVEELFGDNTSLVDVYTITGVRVRTQVSPVVAVIGLNPGLYIIGNKKVLVK